MYLSLHLGLAAACAPFFAPCVQVRREPRRPAARVKDAGQRGGRARGARRGPRRCGTDCAAMRAMCLEPDARPALEAATESTARAFGGEAGDGGAYLTSNEGAAARGAQGGAQAIVQRAQAEVKPKGAPTARNAAYFNSAVYIYFSGACCPLFYFLLLNFAIPWLSGYLPPLSTLTSRATHAHPFSPRSTGFCAIWGCISSSSLLAERATLSTLPYNSRRQQQRATAPAHLASTSKVQLLGLRPRGKTKALI